MDETLTGGDDTLRSPNDKLAAVTSEMLQVWLKVVALRFHSGGEAASYERRANSHFLPSAKKNFLRCHPGIKVVREELFWDAEEGGRAVYVGCIR